ncbi:YwqG family protein [Streptomyces sp. NBC_00445]|uniref:DUF1963 domain-containing protein n=1 Tax=Streptomyces sp. NBC_00445 TaxID=2975745 RepID=UPI002E222CE4
MKSLDPFRNEARRRDLPEDEVERWLGTVRPCVMLGTAGAAPPGSPVAGRLGGLPPMPEGEPVPDLPFLASVDLAAIPPGATDIPLPKDGTLLFFADTEDPWPGLVWSRLVFVPVGTPVSERRPDGEEPPPVHPAQDLHLMIEPSLPNRGWKSEEFPHSSELGDVWWEIGDEMRTDGPVQMGGYPWVWNEDPTHHPRNGPGDWVLLAEIAGEDLTEPGLVDWVIRRDDLAARRFDQARASFDMIG